jgi:nucleoside diphosphate kinase
MKVFGKNVIHESDSHENGKHEIGNIIIWLKVIFS